MDDRTRNILEISIRDFIRTGRPITSEYLFAYHDFGIKPAMIRWELNDLSEGGYFYQSHPSGGRLPTNKAYRFLVSLLLEEDEHDPESVPRAIRGCAEHVSSGHTKELVDEIAQYLQVVSVGYEMALQAAHESGLRSLLAHVEAESKNEILDIIRDVESLPERLIERTAWWKEEDSWPQVFIGENRFTRSDHLSLIVGRFTVHGDDFLLAAVGPKRMNYKKSLDLFKALERALR